MIPDYQANSVYVSLWLQKDYKEVYTNLITILSKYNINHQIIPDTKDVWCRDYMPLQLDEDRFLCYRYMPDYLLKNSCNRRYITDSLEVSQKMGLPIKESSLVIDGGNVVKVGDKVIMTEKVFAENPGVSSKWLKRKLQNHLECEVVFIPWDRYEIYGHSDGVVKPISDSAVLMTNYHDYDDSYAEEVVKRLSKKFNLEFLSYQVRKPNRLNWAYINFLTVKNLIVLPCLGIEEDQQALTQIRQYFPDDTIEQVNITSLIKHGGGLNCVTWCRYIPSTHLGD